MSGSNVNTQLKVKVQKDWIVNALLESINIGSLVSHHT